MQLRETKIGELKTPQLHMMSLEAPLHAAAFGELSFLAQGEHKEDDSPLATQTK